MEYNVQAKIAKRYGIPRDLIV